MEATPTPTRTAQPGAQIENDQLYCSLHPRFSVENICTEFTCAEKIFIGCQECFSQIHQGHQYQIIPKVQALIQGVQSLFQGQLNQITNSEALNLLIDKIMSEQKIYVEETMKNYQEYIKKQILFDHSIQTKIQLLRQIGGKFPDQIIASNDPADRCLLLDVIKNQKDGSFKNLDVRFQLTIKEKSIIRDRIICELQTSLRRIIEAFQKNLELCKISFVENFANIQSSLSLPNFFEFITNCKIHIGNQVNKICVSQDCKVQNSNICQECSVSDFQHLNCQAVLARDLEELKNQMHQYILNFKNNWFENLQQEEIQMKQESMKSNNKLTFCIDLDLQQFVLTNEEKQIIKMFDQILEGLQNNQNVFSDNSSENQLIRQILSQFKNDPAGSFLKNLQQTKEDETLKALCSEIVAKFQAAHRQKLYEIDIQQINRHKISLLQNKLKGMDDQNEKKLAYELEESNNNFQDLMAFQQNLIQQDILPFIKFRNLVQAHYGHHFQKQCTQMVKKLNEMKYNDELSSFLNFITQPDTNDLKQLTLKQLNCPAESWPRSIQNKYSAQIGPGVFEQNFNMIMKLMEANRKQYLVYLSRLDEGDPEIIAFNLDNLNEQHIIRFPIEKGQNLNFYSLVVLGNSGLFAINLQTQALVFNVLKPKETPIELPSGNQPNNNGIFYDDTQNWLLISRKSDREDEGKKIACFYIDIYQIKEKEFKKIYELLTEHSGSIIKIMKLANGNFLTLSQDKSIRIYNEFLTCTTAQIGEGAQNFLGDVIEIKKNILLITTKGGKYEILELKPFAQEYKFSNELSFPDFDDFNFVTLIEQGHAVVAGQKSKIYSLTLGQEGPKLNEFFIEHQSDFKSSCLVDDSVLAVAQRTQTGRDSIIFLQKPHKKISLEWLHSL